MNIDKVYLCDIYVMGNIVDDDINTKVYNGDEIYHDNIIRTKFKTKFLKKALA